MSLNQRRRRQKFPPAAPSRRRPSATASPSTTSAAWACSIIMSVLAGSTSRQLAVSRSANSRSSACHAAGSTVRRTDLGELAAQQDQPQQVAKDDAFLLHQIARADVEIEVAVEAQQFAGRPDRLGAEVGHVGMQGVEQQPQLVGQASADILPPSSSSSSSSSDLGMGARMRPRWIRSASRRVVASGPGGNSSGRGTRTCRSSGRGISSTLSSAWRRSLRSAMPSWSSRKAP